MKITRANVYHNLAVMLEAGLPITRALRTAASGVHCKLSEKFVSLADGVALGRGMHETIAQRPEMFEPIEAILIEVGENSGNLTECIEQLSVWFAFCDRQRKQLVTGLVFPGAILHAAAFIVPLPGFFLSGSSVWGYFGSVLTPLVFVWAIVLGVATIIRHTPSTGPARVMLDKFALKIPVLGHGLREMALSRYFRAFAMMQSAGVEVVRSAQKATAACGNSVVMDLVRGGADSAAAGNPVSEGLSPRLGSQYIETWKVGEISGQLAESAERLGQTTGERAEFFLTEFCKWLPKIIYCMIAIWMIVMIARGWAAHGVAMGR